MLCLGKKLIKSAADMRKDLLNKATKVAGNAIKIANSRDPLTASLSALGNTTLTSALSLFSASQCAGLLGVIVASFTPTVQNADQICQLNRFYRILFHYC